MALQELREETGLQLPEAQELMELKVDQGNAWWSEAHFNFGLLLEEMPRVLGPEKPPGLAFRRFKALRDSEHELVPGGLEKMKLEGLDAGDG